MQNWQNYYQNPNQMYQPVNPYATVAQKYPQIEQNYQQTYQQQYGQQMQMQAPQVNLNGRLVDDFSAINANDVPMDGNGAIFVKRDGSEIQLRNWASNGTIHTTSYKLILEEKQSEVRNVPSIDFNGLYDDVRAIRDEMTERFDRLEKSITSPTTKSSGSRTKKEVDA